jgi:hypothetical protein
MKKNGKGKKKASTQDAQRVRGLLLDRHLLARIFRQVLIETVEELRPTRPDLAEFHEMILKSGTFGSSDFKWGN